MFPLDDVITKLLSYMTMDAIYLCHIIMEEWYKLYMYFYVSYERFNTKRVDQEH